MSSAPPPFELRKRGQDLPPRIIFYGVEGIGKTSFGCQFPNPFFLLTKNETGLETLQDSGQVGEIDHCPPCQTWQDAMSVMNWVSMGTHDYATLVIDTLNGLERLYMDFVIATECGGDSEKFSAYGRDKKYPHSLWQMLLGYLTGLQTTRKMSVLCLSHYTVEAYKSPDGGYDRFMPRMLKPIWDYCFAWSDITLFAEFKTFVVKEGLRSKGVDGKQRVMHTERSPAHDAKNRYKLPAEILMGETPADGYQNFINAYQAATARNAGNIAGIVRNGSSKQGERAGLRQ